MDIEKKRDRVIAIVIFTGVVFPFFLPSFGIQALENLKTWLLFPSMTFYYAFTLLFAELNPVLIIILAAVFQYLLFAFLAWGIIRLVYPNKKALSEPDTPSEPTQG